jgi:neurotrimin
MFFAQNRMCIFSREKYDISEERTSAYQTRIALTITDFDTDDTGTYTCVSTNTIGKAEGTIRLYGKLKLSNC